MNGKSILLSLVILTGCSTPSTVATLNVPLQYKSMASPGEFSTFPPCARLSGARIEDAREDRTLGKRFVEGKSSPPAPVTTTSDVAAWAKQGLDSVLKKSSVGTDAAAAPSLVVTIEQINTNENVLHRAGYDGRIALSGELKSPGGTSCWKGRAEGFAENYGYAGSVENYQETLNHALDRAILHLMSAPEFRKAACACNG
jgi:hypothetical protein